MFRKLSYFMTAFSAAGSESENLLRVRSEQELERRAEGLLELKHVLTGFGCSWFLSGGSLLGAIREGDFIQWDWDVEITLLTEEVIDQDGHMIRILMQNGFTVAKVDRTYENFKIVLEKNDNKYELLGRYLFNDMRLRQTVSAPARFFHETGEARIRGISYPAPCPAEGYLSYLYGDWQTPKRTAVKTEYFTKKAYSKPVKHGSLLKRAANRLLKRLRVKDPG